MNLFKSIVLGFALIVQSAVACEVTWVADEFNEEYRYHEKIGGMPWPESREAFQAMVHNENVGLVLTLTQEALPADFFKDLDDVESMHIPSVALNFQHIPQIEDFIEKAREVFARKKAVVVHCLEGCRRTGEVLACWLISEQRMNKAAALKHLAQCNKRYEPLLTAVLMCVMLFARNVGARPSLPEEGMYPLTGRGDSGDSASQDLNTRDDVHSVPTVLPSTGDQK